MDSQFDLISKAKTTVIIEKIESATDVIKRNISIFVIIFSLLTTAMSVGYVGVVGWWVLPLLSVSDFFQINMGLLQSALIYLGIYYLTRTFLYYPSVYFVYKFKYSLLYDKYQKYFNFMDKFITFLEFYAKSTGILAWLFGIETVFVLFLILPENISNSFPLSIIPILLFYIFDLYVLILIYRNAMITSSYFTIVVLIGMLNFALIVGGAWARGEQVDNSKAVLLFDKAGDCSPWQLIRSVQSGIILFDKGSNQYVFRKSEGIESIKHGQACPNNQKNQDNILRRLMKIMEPLEKFLD